MGLGPTQRPQGWCPVLPSGLTCGAGPCSKPRPRGGSPAPALALKQRPGRNGPREKKKRDCAWRLAWWPAFGEDGAMVPLVPGGVTQRQMQRKSQKRRTNAPQQSAAHPRPQKKCQWHIQQRRSLPVPHLPKLHGTHCAAPPLHLHQRHPLLLQCVGLGRTPGQTPATVLHAAPHRAASFPSHVPYATHGHARALPSGTSGRDGVGGGLLRKPPDCGWMAQHFTPRATPLNTFSFPDPNAWHYPSASICRPPL